MRPGDDAEQLIAWLRVVAVPVLVAGQVFVSSPEPTPRAFVATVVAFALYAVGVVVWLRRGGAPSPTQEVALAVVDTLFAGALTFASGGGFSQLRFAFLFVPVTAAFRRRPGLTLGVSLGAIVVYALQGLEHPSSRSQADALSFLVVQAAYLAWLGAAATSLSWLLARRDAAVASLLAARQRLVAEAMAAEERERKRLSEELHDDAIQNLLAARHDLEESAAEDPESPEARAYAGITATIARLRSAISDLHPYLLDQVGLESAVVRVGERAARRGGFELDAMIDPRTPSANDAMLFRCASELLSNAASHSDATVVRLTLEHDARGDRLVVSDNGRGFAPEILGERLQAGHIGLLSLRERVEVLGGELSIDTAPGAGARVTVHLPRVRERVT